METIVVYIQETSEQTISIPLDDNATAQEVLRSLSLKSSILKESELHEYALFIIVDNDLSPLRERMLSSHECPLRIKVIFT